MTEYFSEPTEEAKAPIRGLSTSLSTCCESCGRLCFMREMVRTPEGELLCVACCEVLAA
jgi:formylmethanofuran dehydrogenase subunit E